MEDQKSTQSGRLKTVPPYNKTPMDTPSKSVNAGDDENRNPTTLSVSVASTPPTPSVPMLTALTPATPRVSCAPKTARKFFGTRRPLVRRAQSCFRPSRTTVIASVAGLTY
ncbi:hypothetical protein OIU79_019289 [Salix purpurea]|uniref:Uncharacterized protein n=1 Tax=Salix purpurea TaxID=77065 RepID=A0A9Q0P0V6_SALPP|nr:hypothetical protein OIU79_019289 [Salix purpurea]